jgi:hypothetical protein
MGIFSRKKQPGAPSEPEDLEGDGPVGLEDRTEPGGQGSPGTNQGKTEPLSPTGTHPDPLAPPHLDEMKVGGDDPQAPRHPAASGSALSPTGGYAHADPGQEPTGLSGSGTTPDATRPAADLTASTGRAPGPEQPLQETSGTAHRAPGLTGEPAPEESVTTDVTAGAARMGPQPLDSTAGPSPGQGDDQSVPSSGTSPAPGTSEEHRIVAGIKLPEESGDQRT